MTRFSATAQGEVLGIGGSVTNTTEAQGAHRARDRDVQSQENREDPEHVRRYLLTKALSTADRRRV